MVYFRAESSADLLAHKVEQVGATLFVLESGLERPRVAAPSGQVVARSGGGMNVPFPRSDASKRIPKIVHLTERFFPEDAAGMPPHLLAIMEHDERIANAIGWKVMRWIPETAEKLINASYPWFYPAWAKLDPGVMRSDAIRPVVLHRYGGLYIDSDFAICEKTLQFLEGLNNLSDEPKFVLWGMAKNRRDVVQCSALSTPNHYGLKLIMASISRNIVDENVHGILAVTGPQAWYKALGADSLEAPRKTDGPAYAELMPQVWFGTGALPPKLWHIGFGSWIKHNGDRQARMVQCREKRDEVTKWLDGRCSDGEHADNVHFPC